VIDPLADLRRQIDALDEEIVRLLNERARCALELGRRKEELGVPIYQPAREREVLEHVMAANGGPLDAKAIRRLFERIIDEARRLERQADENRLAERTGRPDGGRQDPGGPEPQTPEQTG
jgi:chorismate mutase